MEPSESGRRARAAQTSIVGLLLLALAAGTLALSAGAFGDHTASGAAQRGGAPLAAGFTWLRPATAPAGWRSVTLAASQATLSFPPGWTSIPGDAGTVTRALRDGTGRYLGYLNATPRQGPESLRGWAKFRIDHNREEGDKNVREVRAAEHLMFRDARGACVIDDYLSKVANHQYREIACLVNGRRHADVFIGAGLSAAWPSVRANLERAASAFVQG